MQGISNTQDGSYTAGYRWAQYFERCAQYYEGVDQYQKRGNLAKNTYWPKYGGSTSIPKLSVDKTTIKPGEKVNLSWAATTNTSSYTVVVHKKDTSGNFVAYSRFTNESSPCTISWSNIGTYRVWVQAVSSSGVCTDSNKIDITVANLPGTPKLSVDKTIIKLGEKVNLSWAATTNASSYTVTVHKKDASGNFVAYSRFTNESSPCTIQWSKAGTYRVWVQAVSGSGACADSNKIDITVVDIPGTPKLSVNKTTIKLGEKVNLSWAATTNTSSYIVTVHKKDASGSFVAYSRFTNESSPCTIQWSKVGTYRVWVQSVSGSGACADSNKIDITVVDHIHSYTTTTTKAKPGVNGKTVTKCSICGSVKSTTTIYAPKTMFLSSTAYTFDYAAKTPSVTVKDSAGQTISSSNYTVSYASGRKYVGSYKVTVTFKGSKYSGSMSKTFEINPKATTLSSVTAASKGFTARWSKVTTQTSGYQLQYSTSSKFTNAKTVTITSNKTTSKKITKLTAKKKYYVRVRTYKTVSGKKYYSSWSSAKSVTTKK